MTKILVPALTVSALVVLAGCFGTSYGRRVDASAIAKVKTCETSKGDALKILGEPYKTGSVGDFDTLNYEYGGMDGTDRLLVALDKKGVVVDVAHNAEFGYQPQNRCAQKSATK